MHKWLIIGYFISLAGQGYSQHSSFSFRNININEGLSQSSVVDIAFDNAGFLWLATQVGLNRYDGNRFVMLPRNFDDVTNPNGSRLGKIVNGQGNKLWLITTGGKLEQLNILNNSLTPYLTIPETLLGNVSCVYEDTNGALWIGTENKGLFLDLPVNNQKVQFSTTANAGIRLPGNHIQFIFLDSKKRHWIATDNGVAIIQPQLSKAENFLTDSYEKNPISCSSIDEDEENGIWVGTYGKGLFHQSKNESGFSLFRGFNNKENLPSNLIIETVKADQEGRVWVGTYGNGLYVIDKKLGQISHILPDKKNPFSLSYNDVLCIKQDKRGGIWIGTDGGGVSHYDKRLNNFVTISKNNVPDNISIEQVRSITTDKNGGLWIGTSNSGLTYTNLKGDTQTLHLPRTHNDSENGPDRIVSLLTDKDGDIWVGTQGNGLFILDPVTRVIKKRFDPDNAKPFRIPDYSILCMLQDTACQVWLGTRDKGVCLVDKNKGLIKQYASHNEGPGIYPIRSSAIRTLTKINNNLICIGFETQGYQLMNTRTNIVLPDFNGPLEKFIKENITPKCIYFQHSTLWIGTLGKGLMAVNISNGKYQLITEEQGLPSNTIYGILSNEQDVFWMSTNKGICRYDVPADPSITDRSHFTSFTAEQGLQSNEFNTGAYYKTADGTLYFGGIKGLTYFHPDRLVNNGQKPQTVITEATINNEPFKGDTSITYKKILKLPYDQNSFSFNFTALDFVPSTGFNYYYQLGNYDKGWIDAGNRNYAAYTNLAPGSYVFRVKAFQGTDDPVSTLLITIKPPFWRTWWFLLTCAAAAMGILYAFYRYRINQLLKVQRIRNRIASDLHDDIGSSLTNISILSELSRKNLHQQNNAEQFLNRITEEVQHAAQDLDDIVWSINTNEDSLDQIVARMRRYASEIFDAAGIEYVLQFDEQFAHRKLSMEQRRDLFLIFKEAVNNIYKHAQASKVQIRVWLNSNQLHIKIEDNGKGFDTSALTHRNGIRNLQQRAEKWKGTAKINSHSGKGTTIAVNLPIIP
jgi:ligand-binding sensor domain-containing protein/anti-sigma regulatory factor (Ser/Thr protein kinase)